MQDISCAPPLPHWHKYRQCWPCLVSRADELLWKKHEKWQRGYDNNIESEFTNSVWDGPMLLQHRNFKAYACWRQSGAIIFSRRSKTFQEEMEFISGNGRSITILEKDVIFRNMSSILPSFKPFLIIRNSVIEQYSIAFRDVYLDQFPFYYIILLTFCPS